MGYATRGQTPRRTNPTRVAPNEPNPGRVERTGHAALRLHATRKSPPIACLADGLVEPFRRTRRVVAPSEPDAARRLTNPGRPRRPTREAPRTNPCDSSHFLDL